MTVVHHRKEPTKKINKYGTKTYHETHASCGVYSQVLEPEQGMKHTDRMDFVTCEKCREALGLSPAVMTPKKKNTLSWED